VSFPKHQIACSNHRVGWTQSRILVLLAVGYQWFYNGANFVAFKIGGDAVHPLLLASMRFAIAAIIILPFGLWRFYRRPPGLSELGNAAALGVVMLVGSQSVAIIGTHSLPAGVASVFGSAALFSLRYFLGSHSASRWACDKSVASGSVLPVLCSWPGLRRIAVGSLPSALR